jgi:O-methyltransferase involved in polyketide biosynthesis
MAHNFAKISVTAKIAAYMRQFTDIPFAEEVANLIGAGKAFDNLLRNYALKPEDLTWYAPIFESRHKSIGAMIRRSQSRQVLELASGFSPRGLALTADPRVLYVETDLPETAVDKRALLTEISRRHRLMPRDNFRIVPADALNLEKLQAATKYLQPGQPVLVVHEGLLQYLSSSETEQVARNIHALLGQFGGAWITPDFSLKADADNLPPQQILFRRIIAEATDRTLYNNAFENIEHLREYFRGLGFQVEVFKQDYLVPNLVSVDRLHVRPALLDELRPKMRVWSLTRLG